MALKASSTGQFFYPTSPAAGVSTTSGAANTYGTYVSTGVSTAAAVFIIGATAYNSSVSKPTYATIQIGTGSAGAEATVGQIPIAYSQSSAGTGTASMWYTEINPWIPVATTTRVAVKTADSVGALNHLIQLIAINQANVVDAGIVEQADIQTIKTQAASAAGAVTFPSSIQSSTTFPTNFSALTISAATGAVRVDAGTITTVSGNVSGSVGSVTGAVSSVTAAITLPSIPSNWITAAGVSANAFGSQAVSSVTASVTLSSGQTIATVSGNVSGSVGSVLGAVSSVTAAITLPSIPANYITAAGISSAAFNGKGDWNIGKTGYSLSSGQSVATVTGNVSGSVGSVTGLTASNLDTTVSSRMATFSYTAPDNSSITGIKTKTDQLTFTVANQADSNIKSVKGITITGSGTSGSPWGP